MRSNFFIPSLADDEQIHNVTVSVHLVALNTNSLTNCVYSSPGILREVRVSHVAGLTPEWLHLFRTEINLLLHPRKLFFTLMPRKNHVGTVFRFELICSLSSTGVTRHVSIPPIKLAAAKAESEKTDSDAKKAAIESAK